MLLVLSGLYSCNNDDDHSSPSVSVNDFVWKAMNYWYYWQSSVPNLADNRFQSDSEYRSFIDGKQPDALFFSLLYDYGNTDRFSWIVSDYHQLQNEFAGQKSSFGMKYGLVYVSQGSNLVFGYVQYVLPGSPAESAGMKRGDIFTRVNGTRLDDSNYTELLGGSTATFGMAYIENGMLTDSELQITLNRVEIRENPVYLASVIEKGGHRIGYLMYNSFRSNFNTELNEAVGQLKSQGITDLVVDLRYNGGGAVQTCSYLGSMITGQFLGQNFTNLTFNSKRSDFNSAYNFVDEAKSYDDDLNQNGTFGIHHLNMNRVYVLTLSGTASASEMLINSLRPYMEVKTIGKKTYGKTVGSITLYDSPSTGYTSAEEGLNPNHTWAMQPIVFDSKNVQHQASPVSGIPADTEVSEIAYLENLPPLGSENDPLLGEAISQITGSGRQSPGFELFEAGRVFKSVTELESFGTEMYLEKDFELK